jgi:hypothetical protein
MAGKAGEMMVTSIAATKTQAHREDIMTAILNFGPPNSFSAPAFCWSEGSLLTSARAEMLALLDGEGEGPTTALFGTASADRIIELWPFVSLGRNSGSDS